MKGWKRGAARAFFEEVLLMETDECILWPFAISKTSGRGILGLPGRHPTNVAGLVCERVHGPRPPGMQALHSRMPGGHPYHCLNPRHLRWGTPLENAQDRDADGKPHDCSGQGEVEIVTVVLKSTVLRNSRGR
jgi:hypothetical protein